MVASIQVEIPFYSGVGRQRERGFGSLAQVFGRIEIPFLRKYIVPAAKCVGVDLLEVAVPGIAEVVSGRKNIKTAAKSESRQTLRKQLGEGSSRRTGSSRKRSASKIIPTKSAKQISRSQRDIFTNISHSSCRVIFGTKLLWQFLEILEGKSQLLMMSCRPMNKKSILPPHSMKAAKSLHFKWIGTITLI